VSYGPQPGYPQQPQPGQPYGQPHGGQYGGQYGQQPGGYPGYGPPPGYGGPPGYGAPGTAIAYVSAVLFLICGILALVIAIVSWDGTSENVDMLVATVGAAFSGDITGNIDFAIAATMTAACSTITFAVVLFFRLDFVRWLLGFVGGIVTVYYVYAVIKLLSDGGGDYIAMIVVSLLLWAAATVVVLLPATGRAMRGYQRKLAGHAQGPQQPMGYPY
jgi:hypothetical protein